MATKTESQALSLVTGDTQEYPVIAADIIYEGSAVGENGSGYARPLVAADPFLGFCVEEVENSAGAAGAKDVKVLTRGKTRLPIAGLAITANDRPAVYASDDNTFTLTAFKVSIPDPTA